MMWIGLIVALGAGGLSSWLTAKLSKAYYRRQSEKRLNALKAEYTRRIEELQQIQQHKVETIKAVKSASDVKEVSDALDSMYDGFDSIP